MFDQQEIQDRWTEYIERLFNDERGEMDQLFLKRRSRKPLKPYVMERHLERTK